MKTVLITGASSGLGKELALEFSKNCNVIINGRDIEKLKQVYKNIPKGRGEMVCGDITKKSTLDSLGKLAKERDIDILINNAGVYNGTLREIMETNFLAPVEITNKILPHFISRKKGLIININSISGKQGSKGEPAYSASKHALRGFFDSLRYDVTKHGVRILDIYSGGINTSMTNWRKNQNLLMDPKEIAKVIVKNCELYESLSVNEISVGRRHYEE